MLPFIGHNDGSAELAWLTGSGLGWARSESPCVRAIVRRDTAQVPSPAPEDAEMLTLSTLCYVLCWSIINIIVVRPLSNFIVSSEFSMT